MRTKSYIPILTLLSTILMSCTSSMQVGSSSSWNDEIYGSSTSVRKTVVAVKHDEQTGFDDKTKTDLAQLEQKYSNVLEVNMDSIKNDTVVYKAEETNPYRRILSDSYEDSYERRLKGLEDPRYGLENWTVYLSNDYRYALTYDPTFYRVVIMGDQVWVEPWYISNMFLWPTNNLGLSVSLNWGYYTLGNYYGAYYDPWYYNPWNYAAWYTPSYPVWWGINSQYWYHNNNYSNNDYYYGRRSLELTTTNITTRGTTEGYTPSIAEKQTITTRRTDGTSTNPIVTTRNTQTRITPTSESTRRGETTTNEQISITRRGGINSSVSTGQTRTERPTREIGITEPTRRSYNTTYQRSRTTGENYYSTRRTDRTDYGTTTISKQPSTSSSRTTTPTYNRPNRVSTPSSTSSGLSRETYSSGSSERYRSSGSSSSSSSSSRGGGSSVHSSSSGSSSSSSAGSGSSSRRR